MAVKPKSNPKPCRKEDMGIPKILLTAFIRNSKKNYNFFFQIVTVKEDMGIPKKIGDFWFEGMEFPIFYHFWHTKKGNSQCFDNF